MHRIFKMIWKIYMGDDFTISSLWLRDDMRMAEFRIFFKFPCIGKNYAWIVLSIVFEWTIYMIIAKVFRYLRCNRGAWCSFHLPYIDGSVYSVHQSLCEHLIKKFLFRPLSSIQSLYFLSCSYIYIRTDGCGLLDCSTASGSYLGVNSHSHKRHR